MKITAATMNPYSRSVAAQIAPQTAISEPAYLAPLDSINLSIPSDIKSGLGFGALGLLPVVGAMSNFGAGLQAQFNGHEAPTNAAGIGFVSNLAGTATLVGGAIFGNGTAINVGLGMLGLSGLTAGFAGLY